MFYSRLLGTLGAILVRSLLSGKGVVRAGNVIKKSGNRIKKKGFLILPCSLTNSEISGTHWIAFYGNGDSATCFYSFGVKYIPEEIQRLIANNNIITNIFRLQAYYS